MARIGAFGTAEELDAMLIEGQAAVAAEQGGDSLFVDVCPEQGCSGKLIAEGGCLRCIRCGWSRCG